ncbi:META domain-containing protein [Paracoccus luteus]|uniref:META domain-containing protein n=1 Tax=Paracoccus luteus TaxID=2508543 RepID=UPI00106F47EA|nr:META domain-containing protein [Paracoccus luteus]
MYRSISAFAIASSFLLAGCIADESQLPGQGASETRLQEGEWTVVSIGGQNVVAGSPATLLFSADGQVSGNASCNRLIASYTVRGSEISITPGGTTMMMCPPELMEQERQMMELLEAVDTYRIDESGALVLGRESGKQIIARP